MIKLLIIAFFPEFQSGSVSLCVCSLQPGLLPYPAVTPEDGVYVYVYIFFVCPRLFKGITFCKPVLIYPGQFSLKSLFELVGMTASEWVPRGNKKSYRRQESSRLMKRVSQLHYSRAVYIIICEGEEKHSPGFWEWSQGLFIMTHFRTGSLRSREFFKRGKSNLGSAPSKFWDNGAR